MNRARTRSTFLTVVAVALVLGGTTVHANRLIEAQATSGTYCAGTPQACGADVTFTRWFQTDVPYWVNMDAESDAADPGLSQADIIGATQAAFQSWDNVPDTFFKATYAGETEARIAADGINTTLIYNAALDSDSCVGSMGSPSGLLGVTILTEDLPSGEITDADVVLDSADTWAWDTSCTNFDIQTVLTHEFGHAVGIHHTEVSGTSLANRPTMWATYFCDPGIASGRTLETDDETALQCLYPELATHILMDETGSMSVGNRMTDAKSSANDFISDFGDNTMSVAHFAESLSCPDGVRDGYEQVEDWTVAVPALQGAVNLASACGGTPLWESTCCAIGKASELDPSNLLVYTDTEENSSDGVCSADCPEGFCGCITDGDVFETASTTQVSVYVIDMTAYTGTGSFAAGATGGGTTAALTCNQQPPNADGAALKRISEDTGGLYCAAYDEFDLADARAAIQQHMRDKGQKKQNPTECMPEDPAEILIDRLTEYDLQEGQPNSPFAGQFVQIAGVMTVRQGPFGEDKFYVEDCSGGIQVLFPNPVNGFVGAWVTVAGVVENGPHEVRINPAEFVEVLDERIPPDPPIVDPIVGGNTELVGSLMRVIGYAESGVENDRFRLLSDLEGRAPQMLTVFLDPRTGLPPDPIRPGQRYIIQGILGRFNLQNELMPRGMEDIVSTTETTAGVPGEVTPVGPDAMRASYDKATGEITLDYQPACDAAQHTVYWGNLANVGLYNYTGAACFVGASGTATFHPGSGDRYFVIVGEDGIDEGSYGRDGAGFERPEDVGTPVCDRTQNLGGVTCAAP